jgi:fibronectin-binding autotransporter adhesin
MTNKYLSGAYPGGYSLNAKYTGLVIDSTATVGGSGVSVAFTATIKNLGAVSATGYQANGVFLNASGAVTNGSTLDTTALIQGQHAGVFARNAAATVANFGTILSLGAYSAGVYLYAGGTVTNGSAADTTALIASHFPTSRSGSPGVYAKAAAATVANFGTIRGSGYYGNGVQLDAGGMVTNGSATDTAALIVGYNFGLLAQGAAVVSNFGTIKSSYFDGMLLTAGGTVTNGSATDAAALIVGYNFGVYAQGATTITNFGTITSDTSAAVAFHSASDLLVAEAGSKFFGAVQGGGGTLELAGGSGTISGLGGGAAVTGAVTANVSGFGAYVLDAGSSWTLTGTNSLAANQRLTDFGAINGSLALGSASSRLIVGSGASISSAVAGGGGTLELASGTGTITGLGGVGTITGGVAMTFSGFGSYVTDTGSSWTATGINTVAAGKTFSVGGSLDNNGALTGPAGAAGTDSAQGNGGGGGAGGLGVAVAATGAVANGGTLRGGAGGSGGFGYHYGGGGGAGANAANLASGGILTNTGTVGGGAGGVGGAAYYDSPGLGGSGGVGVALAGAGTVTNTGGAISGGAGGVGGGATAAYHDSSAGGAGGAGVTLAGLATLTNTGGTIAGGAGGKGGSGYTNGGNGGAGGVGILATAGATISNTGAILGGAGGAGGTASGSRYHGGVAGAAADGIVLTAGGTVINGSKTVTTALISGLVGVYAGPTGAAKVTNFGTIAGTGGVSVQFKSASDRLIVESGSTWVGSVQGGGGTLELAKASGTITGLGGAGTISGAEAMTFSGFGSYQLDAKGSWTLSGTNALTAGATLIDAAALTNTGALTIAGTVSGSGTLTFAGGTEAIDAGAKITVSHWSLTGGTASLNESLTYAGAFSESAGATVTVGAGDRFTLSKAATLGGAVNGAGTVSMASATLSGLTIGGTTILSVTGTATQTGAVTIGDATASAATLSIAKGATYTIGGAFGMARGTAATSSLKVIGTLTGSAGTGVSVIGVKVADTGSMVAATGTLDFTAALTGTGTMTVDAGATLEADLTAASTLTASFAGASAVLALKDPSKFAATIAGFAAGETIELLGKKATSAVLTGSDLVITNGAITVATLKLTGNYTGDSFLATYNKASGNTAITVTAAAHVTPPAPVTPPHAFIAAMAGLGAAAGAAHMTAGAQAEAWSPALCAPRTMAA